MTKKLICLFLILSAFLAVCPAAFADGSPSWEERFDSIGYYIGWPFKPYKDTIVEQNAPDFSWPYMKEAISYDLIVCTDESLSEIKYERRGLTANYYNFPHTFDVGEYWWSVRFTTAAGTSEWSEASKFFVPKDAYIFTLPEMDDLVSMIPKTHPRLGVTQENIEEFRTYKNIEGPSKLYYENLKESVKNDMATEIPGEPFEVSDADYRSFALGVRNKILRAGVLYTIDSDPEVGKFCAALMEEVASWDINGVTRYGRQDQCHRDLIEGLGYGFDLAYDAMTPAQKTKIIECLDTRMRIHEHPTEGLVSDAIWGLPENPYRSHGNGAVASLLEVSVATLGDVPYAEEFLKKYLPLWISMAPVWGREDGGWGNGTGYARWGTLPSTLLVHGLNEYGIANLSNKAYFQNNYKYNLYLLGTKYGAAFGDESSGTFDINFATYNNILNKLVGTPYALWQNEKYGLFPDSDYSFYYLTPYPNVESKAPYDLPRSIAFEDTGYAALHSDLMDAAGRVSLFFRSSYLGSHNHSHADNNSFTIVAYGEELAADTGYYDAYSSDHYNNYYQTSHAHNTLTFDDNTGTQVKFKAEDSAHINNFITHPDFDLVSGTAYDSYNYEWTSQWGHISNHLNKLERFYRNIIYIRPDQYIIIDDVKKANGEESQFEFWLNSKTTLDVYKSRDGARITNKNAAMDLKIQYPKVTSEYSDLFSGNDLVHWTPTGTEGSDPVSKRVWFTTEPTVQTKIVSTIGVHKTDEEAQYVDKQEFDNWLLMNFEDGTRAYINLTDDVIEMKEYKTDADAIVVKKESIMAVNATTVEKDGEVIFTSEQPASYVYGKDELSISCDADTNVTVKTAKVTDIKNEEGTVIEPDKLEYGYRWNYEDGEFKAYVIRGFHTMYLNNKPMPGSTVPSESVKYILDGKEYEADTLAFYNHDAVLVTAANIENTKDYFYLDEVNDVNILSDAKAGDLLLLNPDEQIYITGENPVLKLRSLAGGNEFSGPRDFNHKAVKDRLDILVEAETYVFLETATGRNWARDILSGGAGISWVHTFGDSVKWEFEVPESGEYYLALKYAGWGGDEEGNLNHLIDINGTSGNMKLPVTNTYGQADNELTGTVCEQPVYLEAGKNYMWIYPKQGSWNLDWIGFIKK